MWTIDRLDGWTKILNKKEQAEEIREWEDAVHQREVQKAGNSISLTGEEKETSGALGVGPSGWVNWKFCHTCWRNCTRIMGAPSLEQPVGYCASHLKQSSLPTPTTQSTPLDAHQESEMLYELYRAAARNWRENPTLATRILYASLRAQWRQLQAPSETSSTPYETGDSEISQWIPKYKAIPSPPSSTTTSIPETESGGISGACGKTYPEDCTLDNCVYDGHSLESLGLTRACECEDRVRVIPFSHKSYVTCDASLCGGGKIEGHPPSYWAVDTYEEWLDERS